MATFQADQAVRYGFSGGVYGRIKVSIFTTWISLLKEKARVQQMGILAFDAATKTGWAANIFGRRQVKIRTGCLIISMFGLRRHINTMGLSAAR